MRPALLAIAAALTLTACVEAEIDTQILGEDQARVTGYIQMNRAIYDMSGGDDSFCETERGGTLVLTETHARCNIDQTGPFAEVFPQQDDDTPAEMQPQIEALDGNRLRITVPMNSMNEGMGEMQDDPAMQAMVRQMMAGFSITFSISGQAIEETTGTVSADGRTASFVIGLDELFGTGTDLPDTFATVVRY